MHNKEIFKHNTAYENVTRMKFFGVGQYDIPIIRRNDIDLKQFVSFNDIKNCKNPKDFCVHFFLYDYQFAKVWNRPDVYINMLSKFGCVCSPDFSTYTDFPKAVQIFNHYKKHWVAAYWQMHNIKVVPTISWGDTDSYSWCFDGEPTESIIAVSSVGTQNNKQEKSLFLNGYNEMLKRLYPKTVIFYGAVPEECEGNIVRIEGFQEKFKEIKNGW